MMFRASLLAAFLAGAIAQESCPEVPEGGCNVCGPGLCVQNDDAIFMFQGQQDAPCGVLQGAGFTGLIPLESCPFLPGLIGVCECGTPPDVDIVEPTPPPAAQPTPCPDVPASGCSVCGEGLCVTNSDAIFSFPGQPMAPCGELQIAGYNGTVPLSQCPFLPSLVGVCECASSLPATAAPVTAMPVTPAPVAPTAAPVAPTPDQTAAPISPTEAPVDPTEAPVMATPAPVPTAPTPFPVFILTPEPTPTEELPPPVSDNDKKMGMGMGMKDKSDDGGKMGMAGMGMSDDRKLRQGTQRGA